MAHIPDHPIIRRIENVMQRDRQFDDTKARTEMATGFSGCRNDLGAHFISQPIEIARCEGADVGGIDQAIQDGCQHIHTRNRNIQLTV